MANERIIEVDAKLRDAAIELSKQVHDLEAANDYAGHEAVLLFEQTFRKTVVTFDLAGQIRGGYAEITRTKPVQPTFQSIKSPKPNKRLATLIPNCPPSALRLRKYPQLRNCLQPSPKSTAITTTSRLTTTSPTSPQTSLLGIRTIQGYPLLFHIVKPTIQLGLATPDNSRPTNRLPAETTRRPRRPPPSPSPLHPTPDELKEREDLDEEYDDLLTTFEQAWFDDPSSIPRYVLQNLPSLANDINARAEPGELIPVLSFDNHEIV